MLSYGYVISYLPRHERFNEAEKLLDLVLKDYSKGSRQYEADGSVTLTYSKKEFDGEKQVILKRNVTESHTAVYSDTPLKFLKFGGIIFYLRDVIPALAFFLFYYLLGTKFNTRMIYSGESVGKLMGIVAGSVAGLVINLLTARLLSKDRSYDRVCAIQFGGIFSVICILAVMIKYTGTGAYAFWHYVLAFSPFIESVGGMALTRLVHLFKKEDR